MKQFNVGVAIGTLVLTVTLAGSQDVASKPSAAKSGLVIHTEDVNRFYQVYEAAAGHPTADQLQHDYIDPGSDGLHEFARLRKISGTAIADTLARRPEIYPGAKHCMAVLPQVRQRLTAALGELGRLYPNAKFPPVTIAVGRGRPVGTTSSKTGVLIGLEALCAQDWMDPNVEDRFVHTITHEYIHLQQAPALIEDEHPTVLEGSLIEGVAEFGAELISGTYSVQFAAMTKGREKEIETAFVADEDKTDLSNWLYNGTAEKPADLGYWVGNRIAKAYYKHAADKHRAFAEVIEMTDPKAFLAKSGWYPGIQSLGPPK